MNEQSTALAQKFILIPFMNELFSFTCVFIHALNHSQPTDFHSRITDFHSRITDFHSSLADFHSTLCRFPFKPGQFPFKDVEIHSGDSHRLLAIPEGRPGSGSLNRTGALRALAAFALYERGSYGNSWPGKSFSNGQQFIQTFRLNLGKSFSQTQKFIQAVR